MYPLSAVAARWTEQLRAANAVLPRRLAVRALGLISDLTTEPDCDATLVHTDLHYGNVLAATRRPWLAIDPKPLAGHPGIELHPLLRNRTDELTAGSSLRRSVRRRVEIACETAGIEERSALAWTIAVATLHALWASRDGEPELVSLNIALAKALED
jgi:streptomycin 6-kinase